MRRKRRNHAPSFIVTVALAKLKGDLTMLDLIEKYYGLESIFFKAGRLDSGACNEMQIRLARCPLQCRIGRREIPEKSIPNGEQYIRRVLKDRSWRAP